MSNEKSEEKWSVRCGTGDWNSFDTKEEALRHVYVLRRTRAAGPINVRQGGRDLSMLEVVEEFLKISARFLGE